MLLLCTACLRGAQHCGGPKAVEVAALRRELTELRVSLDSLQSDQLGREQWRDLRSVDGGKWCRMQTMPYSTALTYLKSAECMDVLRMLAP